MKKWIINEKNKCNLRSLIVYAQNFILKETFLNGVKQVVKGVFGSVMTIGTLPHTLLADTILTIKNDDHKFGDVTVQIAEEVCFKGDASYCKRGHYKKQNKNK